VSDINIKPQPTSYQSLTPFLFHWVFLWHIFWQLWKSAAGNPVGRVYVYNKMARTQ